MTTKDILKTLPSSGINNHIKIKAVAKTVLETQQRKNLAKWNKIK